MKTSATLKPPPIAKAPAVPAMRCERLHFPHQLALVLFLVLLLAVLFGCSRPPQPKTQSSAGSSQQKTLVASSDKPSDSDRALADQVKNALSSDAGVKDEKIDVEANGGVVILKGRVASDDAKKQVHEIAQKVPGVKWVQNQVTVAPKSG